MYQIIKSNKNLIFLFFICTFIIFFFSSKFSPLYNFNYSPDINIYYTIGKGIWHNKVVYKDLFDHKGPIIFFIYAFGYILSPGTFWGLYIVQSCFQLVSLGFTYKTLSLFTNKKNLSIVLSLFIFFFLLNFSLDGGSAEEFIFCFQIISLYYFIKYFKEKNRAHEPKVMFLHGFVLACVFYIKLNMLVFWFFPLIFIFISLISARLYNNLLKNLLALVFGILFLSFFILLYFSVNSAISEFWSSYIVFNKIYVDQIGFDIRTILIELYFKSKRDIFVFSVMIFGLLYFVFGGVLKNKLGRTAFGLGFVITVIFTVPNSIHLHYYLVPLMPFALFGLSSILIIIDKLFLKEDLKKIFFLSLLLLSVVFISSRKNLFHYSVNTLFTRDFPISNVERFCEEISSHYGSTLLVLDIGSGLPVFTALDITPDIKYFFSPNISHELFPDLRESQSTVIINKSVEYIIIDNDAHYLDFYNVFLNGRYNIIDEFPNFKGGVSLLYKRN